MLCSGEIVRGHRRLLSNIYAAGGHGTSTLYNPHMFFYYAKGGKLQKKRILKSLRYFKCNSGQMVFDN